ncbi:Plasma membrane t-SNARE, secretory vesicle fusion [Phlyctochytrium bullatum]|nr:Plasma membrane t-SNARE, secretory vesicle fusion [Phlyctochytrium bullatum]
MARDRLADLIRGQQGGNNGMDMSYTPAAPNYGGNNPGGFLQAQVPPPCTTLVPAQITAPARTPDEFFQLCDMLTNNINIIRSSTDQIRSLNQRAQGEVNINLVADLKRQVDRLCEETSSLVTTTRNGLKVLSQSKTPQPPAAEKNQQYSRLATSLKDATSNFFRVEDEVKASSRYQFTRQYRIARPQASDAEIDHAFESGTSDVFRQELMSSRVAEQRRQLESVQDRARALQRIQNSMAELLRIVEELDAEINNGQVFIDEIQSHVEIADSNAGKGVRQLDKAVNSAASARNGQMWIFIIVVVVLVVIGAIIGIYIGVKQASNTKK